MKQKILLPLLTLSALTMGVNSTEAETFQLLPATFEDLELPAESIWRGIEDDEEYVTGEFASGYFSFNNMFMADWDMWAFFGYASLSDTVYSDPSDQFKCAAGGGHNSPTYGVGYVATFMGHNYVWVYGNDEGDRLKGVWLTNSAWVKHAVYNGDGMSGPFEQGDLLTLVIRGIDMDCNVLSEKRVPLADFRDEDSRNHYCLDTWQWVSLDDLGAVYGLTFEMESTKSNEYGITTPTYFCFDDLHTDREISMADAVYVAPGAAVDITSLFAFDSDVADIQYEVEGENAQLTDRGIITINAKEDEDFSLIISARQRGCSQYVSLPIMVRTDTGVSMARPCRFELCANADGIDIISAEENYSVQVYTPAGVLLADKERCSANCSIRLSAAGLVFVSLTDAAGNTSIKKVLL